MPIFTGILLGLSTLLFLGPVFFYLLKSSMEGGLKAGISVSLGIIVGDIICVLLAIFGFSQKLEDPLVQYCFVITGGSILIIMGIKPFISPKGIKFKKQHTKSNTLFYYWLNGFLINFLNPFVFAVWFGFYTVLINKFNYREVYIALIFTLITILVTDLLKVIFSQKIKKLINPIIYNKLLKVFGVIMICFGVRLLFLLI